LRYLEDDDQYCIPQSLSDKPAQAIHNARAITRNAVIAILLILAGIHCTLSIFYDNESWLNLAKYAAGNERNPYQERIAMIPVLRFGENSKTVQHLAVWFGRRIGRMWPMEPVSPEKLISLFAALPSVLGALAVCSLYGWKQAPRFWWLPPALAVAILYASYAARYEHALWFPYDLPHMFVFGAACACILTGQIFLFLIFFILDLPIRETSIYLIPLSFAFSVRRLKVKSVVVLMAGMLIAWLAVRIPIVHLFHGNETELGSRVSRNFHTLLSPIDWPTLASTLGFLLIPVWLARKYLNGTAKVFLWLTLPCLLITAYFGVLIETRIAVEWTIPFALLAATEAVRAFGTEEICLARIVSHNA